MPCVICDIPNAATAVKPPPKLVSDLETSHQESLAGSIRATDEQLFVQFNQRLMGIAVKNGKIVGSIHSFTIHRVTALRRELYASEL